MKRFVEIPSEECVVTDAWEYKPPITYYTDKHPYVELKYGKSIFMIHDRYILFRFLRALDSELMYADMMFTLYDVPVDERPTLKDIIQGYLDNATHPLLGLWVEDDTMIVEVEPTGNHSRYFESTMQFIRANYLSDFLESIRHMKPYPHAIYKAPIMSFTKDKVKVEVISYKNMTKIIGRYKVGNYWIQPIPTQIISRWVHTIPSKTLEEMLWKVISVLDYMVTLQIKEIRRGGDSERLRDFISRSKLEVENMNLIDACVADKINSFNTSE